MNEEANKFIDVILNHPNDNMDELLKLARSLNPDWDDEDDEWCRNRSKYLDESSDVVKKSIKEEL